MIKLIICDDHQLFREGIIHLLKGFPDIDFIADVNKGDNLVLLLKEGIVPDIVLLDIHMPGISGYETAKYIHLNYPSVKIVGFSAFEDKNAIQSIMSCGAKGFISKNCKLYTLYSTICSVQEGQYIIATEASTRYLNAGDSDREPRLGVNRLSKRELQVAYLMITSKAYKEIAEELGISPNTIENIRIKVFEKTNSKTRTDVAVFLMRSGLVN